MELSMDFEPLWEQREPDFINEEGIKWWRDDNTTKFSKLKNHVVFVIQKEDYITRVIVSRKSNKVVYESQQLEGIGVMADILKFLERTEKEIE